MQLLAAKLKFEHQMNMSYFSGDITTCFAEEMVIDCIENIDTYFGDDITICFGDVGLVGN